MKTLRAARASLIVPVCLAASALSAPGDVVVNEIGAASSDRLLQWSEDGMPSVGAGTPWWAPGFDDAGWASGAAPIGFGYGDIATGLAAEMQGATPSLYVRKTFIASAAQAALGSDLFLDIDYDFGFIAYLNGQEVARCNMGARHGFAYADQPAFNEGAGPDSFADTVDLGTVSGVLVPGPNVLAVQVHNDSLGSGDLRFDAALRTGGGGGVDFVATGTEWRYFPGHVEPSGGVFDPAFLPGANRLFVPWGTPGFDDAGWTTGAAPVGYDSGSAYPLGTNLIGMRDNQTSVYTRRSFDLSAGQLASITALELTYDFDDGFVAYLNGTEIARGNLGASGSFVPYTATSNGGHNASMDSGGNDPDVIETVTVDRSLLVEGENILAAQTHNSSAGSSDLLLMTTLTAAGGPGNLVTPAGIARYFVGTAEPAGSPGGSEEVPEAKFVDWIELHNTGSAPVDIGGWSVTDDASEPAKWTVPPGTSIAAGGYLLLLADGQDQANGTSESEFLHTSFKLDSDGEYVGLYDGTGALRSEIAPRYPDQYPFTSYGLPDGGGGAYHYLDPPTPGRPNTGAAAFTDRAKAPDFSVAGGFHPGTVSLALTSTDASPTIRYTTDGTEPTLTNGSTYGGALNLTAVNSRTGRVVRARSYVDGMLPSKVRTHTYLIAQHSALRSAPALIFTGDEERSFYKPHGVMSIEGGTYVSSQWQPDGDKDSYNIPVNRGIQFERPVFLELYYADGRPGLREPAGVRLSSSGYSRPRLVLDNTGSSPWSSNATQKPSFNIYFRDDYGSPGVEFPWVSPDYPVSYFEQLRLRAGKNDIRNPWVKDELMRRLFSAMGHASSVGTTNSLYINGEFKGYFNLCERLREPFFQAHHGGDGDWDVRQVGDFANGDRASWDEMVALLDQDLTDLSNYQAAAGMLDIENVIDYLLVNIYGATWDWPQNNWVGARERSPGAKWRLYVWDAEGAFAHSGSKPIGHDVIGDDLLGQNNDIPRMFQRLVTSPEFRLHFADRVHRHLFNGGVLDDRDAGTSQIRALKDELVAGFQPLLSFVHGETVSQGWFNNWTNPSSGHRTYLFGPRDTHFRDHGLWPDTAPPALNQFGGEVPAGFALTISHSAPASSAVYFTLDGTDPRDPGGAVSTGAALYGGAPLGLTSAHVKLMARVRDSSGEWSALTEADFLVDTVPASSANVAVAEFMYHPADANAAEEAAGFTNRDDFEYLRLVNTSGSPVDLGGLRFSDGVTFDFDGAAVRAIDPGASVLVVKNRAAFNARYGAAYDATIAGEYGGRLDNGGEWLLLETGSGSVVAGFAYDDDGAWPKAPDGFGVPLLLVDPGSAPDPNLPENWIASARFGGTPGGGAPPPATFADWQAFHFDAAGLADPLVSGHDADPDGNGLPNLIEFALGVPHGFTAPASAYRSHLFDVGGSDYAALEFQVLESAAATTFTVEVGGDLTGWDSGPGATALVEGPASNGDGTASFVFRDTTPVTPAARRFLRLSVTAEP